ncbi:NAD-dependent epimerase/dehydratase family protein [Shewanella dokdonensis]|uniref:NAD-dependent epimerase/dehydratase n=1 Tax=Shewanella dokdonensis TaxID=712036 RepID=A0ABX8DIN8_9GAMM|nr:NAD-dependent epimerase/dehydratase [Shewanella dokdonensis]MCL1073899.1 NAD-dependent epimerase/dehydratase [Shewanella dokdonensis]QVK23677.1 NAD-dependent epimerase/dehydratase [Shewanella dokdonensis]
MKILITGITGYLGSHLANSLVAQHDVAGTIRISSCTDKLVRKEKIFFINTEQPNWMLHIRAFKPDVIINSAALYGRKGESFSDLIKSNVLFPQSIIEDINEDVVFINCGTSLPSLVSQYSLTKDIFVQIAKMQCELKKIKFINLNIEHFFGANDDKTKFTAYVFERCLGNQKLQLTEANQERDFIYIEDLVEAFKCILESLKKLDTFESIDIGTGKTIKIREFVESVVRITKSQSDIEFGAVPYRDHELMYSCADIRRIRELGWGAKYSLDVALIDMMSK